MSRGDFLYFNILLTKFFSVKVGFTAFFRQWNILIYIYVLIITKLLNSKASIEHDHNLF